MSAHTPGPWRVLADPRTGSVDVWSGACCVCTVGVPGGSGEDFETIGPDAALIAAAPKLLETLKNLLDHTCGTDSFCEWCERHAPKDHEGLITGPIPHAPDCLRRAAEAAIARAEGRS